MPYYLHTIGAVPERGEQYPTKQLALVDRVDGQTVTFKATAQECSNWYKREQERFDTGTYVAVSWADQDWSRALFHYAHLSLDTPGLIAYTPDDERGINDRQLRVRPGKYLQEFASHMSHDEIEAHTVKVREFTGELKLARSTEDVIAVYKHGPRSCMGQHAASDFQTDGVHPVAVYGDSDVAVAYLGDLDDGRVSARCVVWPERKVYTRVYGDTAITAILKANGYEHGDLNGAHVRAIPVSGSGSTWVMPYVDGANHGRLVTKGSRRWILFDEGGPFDCSNSDLHGVCGDDPDQEDEDEDTSICSNCENEIPYGTDLCDRCELIHYYCPDCETDFYNDDEITINGTPYCASCADENYKHECVLCDSTWYDMPDHRRYDSDGDRQLTQVQLVTLVDRHVDTLCVDCAADNQHCGQCDEFTTGLDTERCEHCEHAFTCDHTGDLLLGDTPTPAPAPAPIAVTEDAFTPDIELSPNCPDTLQQALRRGRFVVLPYYSIHCHIASCNAQIDNGETAFYIGTRVLIPESLFYCAKCACEKAIQYNTEITAAQTIGIPVQEDATL